MNDFCKRKLWQVSSGGLSNECWEWRSGGGVQVVKVKVELMYKRKLVVRVHVKWKVRGGYTAGVHGQCAHEESTSEGSDSSERLKTASVNFEP
jgi:hypothetical protein